MKKINLTIYFLLLIVRISYADSVFQDGQKEALPEGAQNPNSTELLRGENREPIRLIEENESSSNSIGILLDTKILGKIKFNSKNIEEELERAIDQASEVGIGFDTKFEIGKYFAIGLKAFQRELTDSETHHDVDKIYYNYFQHKKGDEKEIEKKRCKSSSKTVNKLIKSWNEFVLTLYFSAKFDLLSLKTPFLEKLKNDLSPIVPYIKLEKKEQGQIILILPSGRCMMDEKSLWAALGKRIARAGMSLTEVKNPFKMGKKESYFLPIADAEKYIKKFPPGSELVIEKKGNLLAFIGAKIDITIVPFLKNDTQKVYTLINGEFTRSYKTLYHPTKKLVKLIIKNGKLSQLWKKNGRHEVNGFRSRFDLEISYLQDLGIEFKTRINLFKREKMRLETGTISFEYIYDLSYPGALREFKRSFFGDLSQTMKMATLSTDTKNYAGILRNRKADSLIKNSIDNFHLGVQVDRIDFELALGTISEIATRHKNDSWGLFFYQNNSVQTDVKNVSIDSYNNYNYKDAYLYNQSNKWNVLFGLLGENSKRIKINSDIKRPIRVTPGGVFISPENRFEYKYEYNERKYPDIATDYFFENALSILGKYNPTAKEKILKDYKENKCKKIVSMRVEATLYENAINNIFKLNLNQLWSKYLEFSNIASIIGGLELDGYLTCRKAKGRGLLCRSMKKEDINGNSWVKKETRDQMYQMLRKCKSRPPRGCSQCAPKVRKIDCVRAQFRILWGERFLTFFTKPVDPKNKNDKARILRDLFKSFQNNFFDINPEFRDDLFPIKFVLFLANKEKECTYDRGKWHFKDMSVKLMLEDDDAKKCKYEYVQAGGVGQHFSKSKKNKCRIIR